MLFVRLCKRGLAFGAWVCFLCFGLFAWGFGLSLFSYWSISVAPVRGGTYFLCRRVTIQRL
jgi:hypothetical protein